MNAPNMVPVKEIQGFETTPNTWNYSADANQRAMLQYAKADGADYFEMFSNSPMWWMTNNYNPSGAAGGGSNFNLAYSNSFASYIATTAQYFPEQLRDHVQCRRAVQRTELRLVELQQRQPGGILYQCEHASDDHWSLAEPA